jgi:hypothetical protein
MANKKSDPQFAVGDKIKVNMHAARIVGDYQGDWKNNQNKVSVNHRSQIVVRGSI